MRKIIGFLFLFASIEISANTLDSISVDSVFVYSEAIDTIKPVDFEELKSEAQTANSPVKRQKIINQIANSELSARQKKELNDILNISTTKKENQKKDNSKITYLADLAFGTFEGKGKDVNISISFDAVLFSWFENSNLIGKGKYQIIENEITLTFTEGDLANKVERLEGNGPKEIIYNKIKLKKKKKK